MKNALRYLFGCLFALLSCGVFLELLAILPVIGNDWSIYQWFGLGGIGYLCLIGFTNAVLGQNLKFLRTFIHELTHTIFTLLSFKSIRHFQASSTKGGEIHVVGGSNMLILLSPYCIPIFTIFFLLIRPLLQTKFAPYLEFLLGFSYFFHLHTNWLQTGNRQTDITKYPLFTSYSFIILFQLLMLGIILFSFKSGLNAFWEIPKESIEKLWSAFLHFANR